MLLVLLCCFEAKASDTLSRPTKFRLRPGVEYAGLFIHAGEGVFYAQNAGLLLDYRKFTVSAGVLIINRKAFPGLEPLGAAINFDRRFMLPGNKVGFSFNLLSTYQHYKNSTEGFDYARRKQVTFTQKGSSISSSFGVGLHVDILRGLALKANLLLTFFTRDQFSNARIYENESPITYSDKISGFYFPTDLREALIAKIGLSYTLGKEK